MSDDSPGTPSIICHNEVDTLLQSGDNAERDERNAVVLRVHLGSNYHRGARQETISSRHFL